MSDEQRVHLITGPLQNLFAVTATERTTCVQIVGPYGTSSMLWTGAQGGLAFQVDCEEGGIRQMALLCNIGNNEAHVRVFDRWALHLKLNGNDLEWAIYWSNDKQQKLIKTGALRSESPEDSVPSSSTT